MKLRAVVPLLAAVAQGVSSQAVNRPEPRYFRYARPVERAGAGSGQTCVTLDAGVFVHAASGLADVRLYAGAREVPYAVHAAAVPNVGAYPQPSLLNLGERGGRVVFDARVSHPSYATVEMQTGARNFIASVDVSGSRSPSGAATRLGTYTIFDLTGQRLDRSTVMHLPPSDFPYLHFEVTGPLAPSDVGGVAVLEGVSDAPVYTTVAESRQVVQRGRESVVSFRVPARVPVERVEVVPGAGRNFSRAVTVEAANGRRQPERFAGTVFRVHAVQRGVRIDQEQNAIGVAASYEAADTGDVRWTVTIDNGDDPPLPLAAVRLAVRERRVCFDAAPGGAYVLYYGDSTLAAPRYDYATLFRPADSPVRATLAAERANPRFVPRPDARPLTERYPALLPTVLVLVVAVLGVVAVRTGGHVRGPTQET